MSESVSGVDAILAGLEERARREPHRGCVSLLDAEAAVHATVREIEAWLRGEDDLAELYASRASLIALADEVARRFGGTE